ncbi:bifunctional tetrahydrofolate synthase/dihydrofolate synthase [Kangiella sp. HZ709]|nr:bifunctional tetrahydrofolate synthase/dihydrofolate synthase [Kangiella sp. HZ709]
MSNLIRFETLSQWLRWLEASHPQSDIELGLSRVTQVAAKLNLLSPVVPVVTVAGTNGKGSVIATLESLAHTHQLSIGSYTSPHLIQFNERIKVNGEPVSDEFLIEAFSEIANNKGETQLTYFEFTTLVGLYCFSQEALDFIALEVGLGGRLDAVNIVDADVSVITSIGLDHTDWLGDSLEAIAYEKAGVGRSGRPMVIADGDLLPLLAQSFEEIKPKTIIENIDYYVQEKDQEWSYSSTVLEVNDIPKSSLYMANKAAALTAFADLFPTKLDANLIKLALENVSLLGRFSSLSESPRIVLDVAHNPDSAALLNKSIEQLVRNNGNNKSDVCSAKVWAICGMLQDKDIVSSLDQLTNIGNWLCIDLVPPRGAKAQQLAEALKMMGTKKQVLTFNTIEKAFEYYKKEAALDDPLIVFGSFLTVGQMLEYWQSQ